MSKAKGKPQRFSRIVSSMTDVLEVSVPRPTIAAPREDKKNYAERFSRAAATWIANGLRRRFRGITPDEYGSEQERRIGSARGPKKLDVAYSTTALGLALGVSVKSINFRDPGTQRYTKNYSRNDNELRAEALDYHVRQPFAVLAGILFMPEGCYYDKKLTKRGSTPSSFEAAVIYFRQRAGRRDTRNDHALFERFFLGIYSEQPGATRFFDVMMPPPANHPPLPDEGLSFEQMLQEIGNAYDERNSPPKPRTS